MKPKRILVFANGLPPNKKILQPYLMDSPLIVAADGGANYMVDLGISPHYIVGDMDSLDPEILHQFPNAQLVKRIDQNRMDMEKTLEFCLEKGGNQIFIFGATGKRLDHEIANLGILQQFSKRVDISIIDTQFLVRVVRKNFVFRSFPGQEISILALQPASGVSIRGVKFPLENATIEFGGRGISNIAIADEVSIYVDSGELFLFVKHHAA